MSVDEIREREVNNSHRSTTKVCSRGDHKQALAFQIPLKPLQPLKKAEGRRESAADNAGL